MLADDPTLLGREITAVPHGDNAVLVEQCLNQQERAWAELHRRYERLLRAYVCRLLPPARRNGEDVERLVQEVWVSLLPGFGNRLQAYCQAYRHRDVGLAAYLYWVAFWEVRKAWQRERKDQGRAVPLPADDLVDPQGDEITWFIEVEAMLERLPELQRQYVAVYLLHQPGAVYHGSTDAASLRKQEERVRRALDAQRSREVPGNRGR